MAQQSLAQQHGTAAMHSAAEHSMQRSIACKAFNGTLERSTARLGPHSHGGPARTAALGLPPGFGPPGPAAGAAGRPCRAPSLEPCPRAKNSGFKLILIPEALAVEVQQQMTNLLIILTVESKQQKGQLNEGWLASRSGA